MQARFDPSQLAVRRATAKYTPAIGAVFDAAVRAGWGFLGELAQQPMFHTQDWDQPVTDHAPPNALLVAAEQAGTVLGYTAARPGDREMFLLLVEPTYAGQGVGRALLGAAHDALRDAGCKQAFLSTHEQNDRALATYKRAGYLYIGSRDDRRAPRPEARSVFGMIGRPTSRSPCTRGDARLNPGRAAALRRSDAGPDLEVDPGADPVIGRDPRPGRKAMTEFRPDDAPATQADEQANPTAPPVPSGVFLLELVPVPVSDIDRARAFYSGLGFHVDVDARPADGVRVVQLTPPGSACSITLAAGIPWLDMPAGSLRGLHLVVRDIEEARTTLIEGGADVGPVQDNGGVLYAPFADPDGNTWTLQCMPLRV